MVEESTKFPHSLATLVPKITAPAFAKRSRAEMALFQNWSDYMGDYAKHAWPEKLTFKKGEKQAGILVLNVLSSHAMDYQMLLPVLIERVNQSFGFNLIEKITLKQVSQMPSQKAKPSARKNMQKGKRPKLDNFPEGDLKTALQDLGQHIKLNEK